MHFLFCALFATLLISACVSSETTTTLNNPNGSKVEFDAEAAAQTRIKLALLYLQSKQIQQAKESLDKALHYLPNNGNVLRAFAYYYQQVNDNNKAEIFYNKSLSADPDNGDTYHNYGTFLCSQARYKEADKAFLTAIKLPSYIRIAESYQNAAICAEEAKNLEKAIYYGEYALSYNPNNINLNLFLAKLNITVKKYQAAKLNLMTFQRKSKSTAESLWQWVRLSYAEGNEVSVSKHGEQLIKLFPGTPQVLNYVNKKYYD